MEKGGGMGACGVEMMQVDYIFRGENLKYIRSYWHITASATVSTSAIHARAGWLAETGRVKPIGYTEVETAWRPRPLPDSTRSYLYQSSRSHHPRCRPPLPHFSNKKLVMYSYSSRFAPRF